MLWVGLTGGIASGKSTVAGMLRKSGIPVVDADELARQAVEKGNEPYQKVLSHFGPSIFHPDGSLDRKRLGALAFADPEVLKTLETFIHPFVQEKTKAARSLFETQSHPFAVYDVPLLFEKNLAPQFDRVVVVGCSEAKQIERMKSRNGFTEDEARARLRSQIDLATKMKMATDVIWNEGTLPELELQVENLIQKLRAATHKG